MSEARANNKGKEACTVNVKEFTRGEVSDEPKAYGSMSDNTEVATDASIIDRLAGMSSVFSLHIFLKSLLMTSSRLSVFNI